MKTVLPLRIIVFCLIFLSSFMLEAQNKNISLSDIKKLPRCHKIRSLDFQTATIMEGATLKKIGKPIEVLENKTLYDVYVFSHMNEGLSVLNKNGEVIYVKYNAITDNWVGGATNQKKLKTDLSQKVKVLFFDLKNYKNLLDEFHVGDFTRKKIRNNRYSSILIPDGLIVSAYKQGNLMGNFKTFSESIPALKDIGWNNDISSLRVFQSSHKSKKGDFVLLSKGEYSYLRKGDKIVAQYDDSYPDEFSLVEQIVEITGASSDKVIALKNKRSSSIFRASLNNIKSIYMEEIYYLEFQKRSPNITQHVIKKSHQELEKKSSKNKNTKKKKSKKKKGKPHSLINYKKTRKYDGYINSGDKNNGVGEFSNKNGDTTRKWIGGFKDQMFHGEGTFYFTIKGNKESSWWEKIKYKENKIVDGEYKRTVRNGEYYMMDWKDGKRYGTKGFRKNKTLEFVEEYENGKTKRTSFYQDDGKTLDRIFDYDKNGNSIKTTAYYDDGKTVKIINDHDKDENNYYAKMYHRNGNLSAEGRVKNGKNYGVHKEYHSDGSLRLKAVFDEFGNQGKAKYYEHGKTYIGGIEVDSNVLLIFGGIVLLFFIIYYNQRKIRGLKFLVKMKDGKFEHFDVTQPDSKVIKPKEMMKAATQNAIKLHFASVIGLFSLLLTIPIAIPLAAGAWYVSAIVAVLGYLILILPFLLLRKGAQKTFIKYDLDQESQDRYKEIIDSFQIIERSANSGYYKVNHLITLYEKPSKFTGTLFQKSRDDYIKSNVNFVFFGHGLFLPDYLYCYLNMPDNKSYCSVLDYDRINVDFRKVSVKTEYKLSDHEVTGQTWRHPRKDGQPDKRFNDNPPVYIVNEGRITFGQKFYEDISSVKLAKEFETNFNKVPKIKKSKVETIDSNNENDLLPMYEALEKNSIFILLCVAQADEGGEINKEEFPILNYALEDYFQLSNETLSEIMDDVQLIAVEQDIVYNEHLRGTLNYLAKTEKKDLLLTIKTFAQDIAGADGVIDGGEKLILEAIDDAFKMKGKNEIFKPVYDSGVYANRIFVFIFMYNLMSFKASSKKVSEEMVENIGAMIGTFADRENNVIGLSEESTLILKDIVAITKNLKVEHDTFMKNKYYPTIKYLKNELNEDQKIDLIERIKYAILFSGTDVPPSFDRDRIWLGVNAKSLRKDAEILKYYGDLILEWDDELKQFEDEAEVEKSKPKNKKRSVKKDASTKTQKQNDDHITQIKKLSDLRDQGILTDEEFESKKKDLLDRI